MKLAWSWAGACSVGSSHLKTGSGCDDSGACIEVLTRAGPTLIAVVSDGAGSARFSAKGSRIVSLSLCRSVFRFAAAGGRCSDLDRSVINAWLDEIRDRIEQAARRSEEKPRAFAATLVACIVEPEGGVIIHVGDGACAFRRENESNWIVPSWPAQGEYAATTYFVTDDPEPRVSVVVFEGVIDEVAAFTDGLERLALDFAGMKAFDPFFESMFRAIRRCGAGRQRALSRQLRAFLDSEAVTDRTDDDKTLVMARRVPRSARL